MYANKSQEKGTSRLLLTGEFGQVLFSLAPTGYSLSKS
jgi:hypothetical protein